MISDHFVWCEMERLLTGSAKQKHTIKEVVSFDSKADKKPNYGLNLAMPNLASSDSGSNVSARW